MERETSSHPEPTKPKRLLDVCDVQKAFGDHRVLKGVDLTLDAGEVLALIGGNGAGKSTLMKIIMGVYQADAGSILVNGESYKTGSPSAAQQKGIYMVPQEPLLFPNMTVEQNVLMGFSEKESELRSRLKEWMRRIDFSIDLSRKAITLSIAEQQLVELLRGLLRQSKILILDEPTSALTFDEVNKFFIVMRDLQKQGIGMIYITHRLTEVFDVATSVAIMRDGKITVHGSVRDFRRKDLINGLLPEPDTKIESCEDTGKCAANYEGEPLLALRDFSGFGFSKIHLNVYGGEILGVAGVLGAGRSEIALTLFGKEKPLGGQAFLDGKDITGFSTHDVIEAGLNYVAEDRRRNGVFLIGDVCQNTTTCLINTGKRQGFFINFEKEKEVTQRYVDAFHTKITSDKQALCDLSGGNQQKIVIARALATHPKVLILDEPTRGIDAAARVDVYAIIRNLRAQGIGVVLISSDMEEIVELADRAVSIHNGRINRRFKKEEINLDDLMAAAFGVSESVRK